jgi:hypothetical protein
MNKKRHFCVLFISLLLTLNLSAQTPRPAKTPAAKKCEPQMAGLLIDQLAADSKTIDQTDKRINVLIKVADFLWAPDVEAARPLFAEAFQIARDRYKEKGLESSTAKSGLITSAPDYRFQVIRAIAKRDSKWARQLTEIVLKDKQEEAENAKRNPFDHNREVGEIIQIALALLDTDEASAFVFLRRAMQFPLEQHWIYALHTVFEKKGAFTANALYSELIRTYSGSEPSRILYLSLYPFGAQRMIGIGKSNLMTSLPPGLLPDRNNQVIFLTTLLRRINTLTPEAANKPAVATITQSAHAFAALNEIEPLIAQQFPELADLFVQARTTAIALMTDQSRDAVAAGERRNNATARSFEEKIKELEEAEEKGKLTDAMIANMVMGIQKEEYFEMLESWLDKIQEESVRNPSFQYFYFSRSKLATKESRFEDSRRYADKLTAIEHRAILYLDVAEARLKEKDPTTRFDALDSLNEVYKMAQKAPDTVEKAQVFLGLAYSYEGIDHLNALDALSNAVKTAGKLNAPDLLKGYMTQQIVGKDFAMFTSYSVPGFDISGTFYKLSNSDFQGTLTQAEGFTDKYLRTLAVLAVIRDCEKNIKPVTKPKAR